MSWQWTEIRPTGQAQDPTSRNVGPDLWNSVTSVVFRDGAAEPDRVKKIAFSGKYPTSPANTYYLRDLNVVRRSYSGTPQHKTFWTVSALTPVGTYVPYIFYRDYDGTAISDITPGYFAGGYAAENRNETGGTFNGCQVFNWGFGGLAAGGTNGIYPGYYDFEAAALAATMSVLPGWNTGAGTAWRANFIRPFRNWLVAGRKSIGTSTPTIYPNTVFWSDGASSGVPASWTSSATNQAGETELDGRGGPIVDGYQLGNDFVIFKERAAFLMSYVGGTGTFAFRLLNADNGLMHTNCAAQVKERLVVLGRDDVYALSPNGDTESLITGTNRRSLFRDIGENQNYCDMAYSSYTNEIIIAYRNSSGTSGYMNKAVCLDLDTGKWGDIDLTFDGSKSGILRARSLAYHASIGSTTETVRGQFVWFLGNGTTDNSAVCWADPEVAAGSYYSATGTSTLTKNALDLGDPSAYKIINAIRLILDATAGEVFTVVIDGYDSINGTVVSTGTFSWTAGTTRDMPVSVSGRFFNFQISSAGSNVASWRLSGIDIQFKKAGNW